MVDTRVGAVELKPPYRVPSMAEIRKTKLNGYKMVSTFSGGGGTCLGYKMAGFEVIWANEFVPIARETYSANSPDTYMNGNDIRIITPEDIFDKIQMKKGELDVFEGSPPCKSFSTAGKKEKDWGKVKEYYGRKQRMDDLFFDFIRLTDGLQPKIFIAENVSGLVKGAAKGMFREIMIAFKECGYRVKACKIDASWLGLPQMRERLFIMGIRNDLDLEPEFPKPLPYRYLLKDILPNVRNTTEELEMAAKLMGPVYRKHYYAIPQGHRSRKYYSMSRLHWGRPSKTIMAGPGPFHPLEERHMTESELRQICSFPADFKLLGSAQQRRDRMGLSVPPIMAKAIAEKIKTILDKINGN